MTLLCVCRTYLTHSYVIWLIHWGHDSLVCVQDLFDSLVCVQDMAHSYVTWLIHM